jgi:hypothetical protein
MSSDFIAALAFEKIQRYQAEATEHRRTKVARAQDVGAMDRMVRAIGRGLTSIGESFKIDRRPRIPAI